MKFCIFTGPTLPAAEGQQQIDAIFLPPAAESDVYRAVLDRPVVIGLTGGYFERVPSVPYKQILRAMAQGIHVLGTSSIGALRAAELSLFVMEGVGAIYEMCARGHLDAARTMEVGR
ncbi:TfuA-like protein [Sorangium sp. So ce1153]|uniref:TfuA-like protein n=1 Tax=Sorangium sp. So ce1153 TaxID=3133333 RepID=UPI003F620EDD